MVFFIGAELLVGALLLLALTSFIFNSFMDTEEEAIAKDLGLSIMAVASSPYDLRYHYSPGNERLFIDLTEGERAVRVSSTRGYGVYTFKPMRNVEIVRGDIGRVLSVPIFFYDNKIFFESPEEEQAFFDCESIIARFPESPTFYFSVGRYESLEEQETLNNLKAVIEGMLNNIEDPGFLLADNPGSADVLIVLEFSDESRLLESFYFQSQITAKYQKISCNIVKSFSLDEDVIFLNFRQNPDRWNERILLRLGKQEDIMEGYLARYADTIIRSIKESIR